MANKTLTATVKLNTKDAEASLTRLKKKIDAINKVVNASNSRNSGLTKAIAKANTTANNLQKNVNKVDAANKKAANSARGIQNGYKASNTAAGKLLRTVKSLAATYLGIMGAKAVIGASDTITSAENRLNNLPGGNAELTQLSMDKIYSAAQRSRSGYGDMLSNVSKTMTLAGESFDNNIDNAIRFQEIMAKSYTVGGASAAEQASSMYQLVQALGSGILQGDELRSVREGAPLAYKAIEEFAQGVLKTDESLKELASQGKITSDMVVAAIMNAEEQINKSFENTQMTFAQGWEIIKNMALQAFRPVLQMFNDVLNSDVGNAIINAIGHALVWLANTILWIGDILGAFFNWCAKNWGWLQYVVIFALSVIATYLIYTAAVATITAIQTAMAWLIVHWQLVLIIGVIALLVTAIVWLANTTASGAEFMITAIAAVALAILLIGIITGSTVLLVIAAVVAAVGLIIALLAYCGEEVMGIIYTVGAFIYNTVVGTINQCLQVLWSVVDPILGIVEWIYNAFNGGFNGIGGACANLVGQMCSWFLSLGKVVTTIIDAIFGTDWTSGLSSLQDKVLAWGKNENALTISRDAPTVESIAGKFGVNLPNRIAYGDAYSAGAATGVKVENALESFGSNIKGKVSGFSDLMDLGKFTGTDNPLGSGIGDPTSGSYLPGINDPAYALDNSYNPEDLLKSLENIDSDVGDIKDSMDLSNDDLEYLRKIADMEWRNEFTTAEIKVDMTNNNTVNSERDLDGIVEYLSDVLRAEMTSVAYGDHY